MYEPIGSEFLTKSSESQKDEKMDATILSCENREKFLGGMLSEYLNSEKIREKESLVEKLKYRHHQLELASKQMKKEKKKREDALALAAGETSTNQKPNPLNKRLVLSSKIRKKLKMYQLNKNESLDYSKYEQMNKLWHSYATSCLMSCFGSENNNNLTEESVLNCLKQLDYHGCHLTVVKSPSKSLIGLHGLVLQDKKNVFYLLTSENKVKIAPKLGSLFEFELMGFCKMTLVGSNICHRPEMRSTKHAKIKTKNVL